MSAWNEVFANAVRTNSILLFKGVYNGPVCYTKNDSIGVLLASTLMAACGLRCTNPSSETLAVYEDAPTLNLLDHGPPGNSPGDVYHFFASLRRSPGGPVTGEVFGSKTLFKVATDANPNAEKRATLLFFTFSNAQDQIYRFGRSRLFADGRGI